MNTCVGGRARKLIDARFLRALDAKELERLEAHLAACGFCSERYRRLQLAHRVAASGPERAFEEPSPLEIERIAGDLGLTTEERRRWSFAPGLRWIAMGAAAAIAVSAASVVLLGPPREELPVARGSEQGGVSFAAYLISTKGEVRAFDPRAPVKSGEHLKLRASFPEGLDARELKGVEVVIRTGSGKPRAVHLDAPAPDQALDANRAASIPGAVPLELAPGFADVYVIAARRPIDRAFLESSVVSRPHPAVLAKALGASALSVDRLELQIGGGPGP